MRHIVLIAPSRSGHNWTMQMLRSWLPDDKLHDFEAIPPCLYNARVKINIWQGGIPKNDQPVIPILQIRDFLNYAASVFKHMINNNNTAPTRIMGMLDVWFDVVKEAFGDTCFIKEKHNLFYDSFVESEQYRRDICYLLGGEYSEENINIIPTNGPGSSFDKYDYQGEGSRMKVLDRWKWFLTDEGECYIHHLRTRKAIIEYYIEHFELSPEQRELANYILR